MPWARLDDAILDNPKIASVGPLAFALHVAAITYCARNLTDGFVPLARVSSLLNFEGVGVDFGSPCGYVPLLPDDDFKNPHPADIAESLAKAGLWVWCDSPKGYWLHDYLDYNPSKEKVLAERERQRKKSAGHRTAGSTSGGTEVSTEEVPRDYQNNSDLPVPVPVPSTPVISNEITSPPEEREAAKRSKERDAVLAWLANHNHPARSGPVTRWTISQGWAAVTIIAALERAVAQYGPKDPMAYVVEGKDGKPSLLSRVKVERGLAAHDEIRATEKHARSSVVA